MWSCIVNWCLAEGYGSGDQCYPVGPCDLFFYVALCTGPSVAGRMICRGCIACIEWCASCVLIYKLFIAVACSQRLSYFVVAEKTTGK